MIRRATRNPCKGQRADLFALSLLLAEGQTGTASKRWPAFIDRLSAITDEFAAARAERTSDEHARRVLVSA
jgi:hypothetical protein